MEIVICRFRVDEKRNEKQISDFCWKEKGILQKMMWANQRKILHEVGVGKYNFYTIE